MDEINDKMTTAPTVTNGMLYELLKEFKLDVINRFEQVDKRFEQVDNRFEQVDKRFEQVDKRFEQVDKRFEQVDKHFDDVNKRFDGVYAQLTDIRYQLSDTKDSIKSEKHEREKMQDKLEEIYECRNTVAIRFTRVWIFASFFIALLSSTIILAIDKAF